MPRYNPKTFTKPESLKAMDPVILRQLFGHFADFFESKGLRLDEIPPGEKLPYGHLAELIAAPEGAPELAEALYIIDEMATEKRFDDLIDRATAMKLLDSLKDPTPADLATALWLADPVALQRMHASSYLDRQRRFLYFYEDESEFSWDGPSERELVSLERDFDNWFIRAKRGIGCKVFYFFRNEEHWFLVWHGLPYRREGTVVEGEPGSVVYRPEKYDVLGYHPERGELKIHAATQKEVAMYREYLADLLIGAEATFRVVDRYSLEPLQTLGPKALAPPDRPRLVSDSCSSAHGFANRFLQRRPRGSSPCGSLRFL